MAVLATAIWRIRPSGVNTNGGGYDPGIGGAATDYSQQNAAQATGTNGSGSATTTFTDATAAAFTSAMVGNAINITGQGTYFVVTFTSTTQVVVDRALGTFSGATWHLGGGWADWTNTVSTGPIVPGNTVYLLGSGTPNPSSYVYDSTIAAGFNLSLGDSTNGTITYANDPATPGYKAAPDTTGGMPTVNLSQASGAAFANSKYVKFVGIWWVTTAGAVAIANCNSFTFFGCVLDQTTFQGRYDNSLSGCHYLGSEGFSSTGGSAGGSQTMAINANGSVIGCNIHDTTLAGIYHNGGTVYGNIIAKTGLDGITITGGDGTQFVCMNNTIDGNLGNGILIADPASAAGAICINNIISNQTVAGKAGIKMNSGTTADVAKDVIDFNSFYNNTANYSGISAGPHDTALGVTPYVASSTENYTLA